MEWFAVRVKPRHEKSVTKNLELKGIESFLPVTAVRHRWSDRIQDVSLPLFPGYAFARFRAAERIAILNTPGVINIIRYGRELAPIDREEIVALQVLMKSGLVAQPSMYFQGGDRVSIQTGPLAGCEGTMVDTRKRMTLILSVTLLGRAVSVEIDPQWVTRIPTPHSSSQSYIERLGMAG